MITHQVLVKVKGNFKNLIVVGDGRCCAFVDSLLSYVEAQNHEKNGGLLFNEQYFQDIEKKYSLVKWSCLVHYEEAEGMLRTIRNQSISPCMKGSAFLYKSLICNISRFFITL